MSVRNLILVLGDQLTPTLSSLRAGDPARDRVLMAELDDEATYVRHHQKKIAFLFSAMRHFADELRGLGWTVDYVALDDPECQGSFTGQVAHAIERLLPERLIVTQGGEWRVAEMVDRWHDQFDLTVRVLADDRFVCAIYEFAEWAEGRRSLRMEFFYREMRKKTGLLMEEDGRPAGGKWNYDALNRKPAHRTLYMPEPFGVAPDAITRDCLALTAARFGTHFGDLEPFSYAVTRADAEAGFEHFVATALRHFGDYQDAMLEGVPFLYHAVISLYLNCGLLDPLAVCRRVEEAWRAGEVPLNSAEGFIRQIIGWREYIRGVYWMRMPGYEQENWFGHARDLPDFYWTADTDMACVKGVVGQTKEHAYAHHIQRLMVTGNFALLAGVDPAQVHEWYLIVYADAYEWVEMPNVIGMSQFADGGLLASKPYVSTGAYIDRMSNYCERCRYDVKARTGPDACPFNPLYWTFLERHREKLAPNTRMAMMYRTYARFDEAEKKRIAESAERVFAMLDRQTGHLVEGQDY